VKPIFPRYPGIAKARAHHLARRAVERELRAKGRRAGNIEILGLTQAYELEHKDELLALAYADVRRSPWHWQMAQQQSAKSGAPLPVTQSDH
jgi:hypothetical protein